MTTENTVAGALITGTSGNDSILNFGDDATIDSRSGNDTIYSGLDDQKADRVSINAGAGDNVISVQGGSDSVTIRTADGNNVIGSTSPNNAVFSGAGNDSVTFYTGSDNNTVDSGEGNDVIDAVGHNVTINAGDGDDRIRTYRNAYDITIKAGMGNDDVTLGGPVETDHTNVVQYASGDGNDTITTFSETDTLQITSGSISGAELIGNNVVITVGGGKITLVEANNMNINILDADGVLSQTVFSGGGSEDTAVNDTLISGTDGDDYLLNDKGSNVTMTGLGGNDTIENTGDNTIIDSGEGDNLVSVAGAEFVTVTTGDGSNTVYSDSNGASGYFHFGDGNNSIVTSNRYSTIIGGSGGNGITLHNGSFESSVESGSGDDTIAVGHHDITVDAGEGNDLINLYRDAENSLIRMGEGNDTVMIYNNQHAQTFQYSGGNDIITGFDANDTLKIVGPASSTSIISDGNLIFDFGDGTITLAGVSSAESLNVEYFNKWSAIDGGFVYSGHATNDTAKSADVSLVGADLKDSNGDGAPDNVKVKVFKQNVLGIAAVMSGLSGEITLNNSPVGVIGDNNYEDHFIAKVRDDAPDSIVAFSKIRELRGISDGATVNATTNDMIAFDANAKVHFGDVENVSLNNKNWVNGSAHAQIGIANNGAGADLTIVDNILTEVGGLEDGYSISLVSSDNVSDELTFQTDGGNGTISVGDTILTVGGENNFTLNLDGNGKAITEYWTKIDGGFVYSGHATNNYAKTADVSLIGADLKDEDGDGTPDNVKVEAFSFTSAVGVMSFMKGLSGEVTVNNKDVGVSGDDDYEIHFTAKVPDNASEAAKRYAESKEVRGISTGATVKPNENDIIGLDENAKVHVSDAEKFFLYNQNHKATGNPHAQIGIANNGAGADLTVEENILTEIGGLKGGYSVSLVAGDNVSDEVTFSTDGGQGTISAGKTTLIVDGDEDFAIRLADTEKNISGLKNFSGSATLIGNETFDSDIALAIQRGSFTLGTDENYSSATLANSSGESLNIYYTNDTTGGVIDLSDETLTNTLIIGQGEATTVIGSQGDDQLIGNSPAVIQVGNAGKDTFRGGANLETVTISDYVEGEDVIYHARPFANLSINGSIEGSDYVFKLGTKSITVKDGAEKVVKGVDVNGESRNFSKYLTLDDNDPATVTAQSGVATIDALLRTTDINIIGSDDDNTIISSSGDCTLYGGEGNDTFVRGTRAVDQSITIADYTENEDAVRHSRPFSEFSLLSAAKSVGDDYVFEVASAKIEYTGGANKKIKVVDVNGDVSYFGDYITIRDYDADNIAATEKVKVLDASERTEDINLVGNSIDNTILSGTGNNTLTGGEGNNVFVYGAGNDIITDYEEGDTISLGSAISNTSVNGSNVIFTTELGTLTVQNAVSKNLNVYEPFDVYYLGFIEGKDQVTVTNSEELASLENAKTSVVKISGSQITNLSQFTNSQIVSLGSGQQIVNLNNEDGNVVIVNRNSSGNKNIIFNGGADLGVFNNSNVSVNVNLANAENSTITANAGNITLGGYDYNKDAKIVIPNVSDVADAIVKNSVAIDGNKIKTSSAAVTFDNSKNSRLINLVDGNGRAQKVGFVENTSLNLTDESENLLIKAGTNSAIISGSGNDTILAGSGAVIDAGIGQNQIYISSDEDSLNKSATVVMSNGSSTVHGFGTGYDSNNSRIKVDDLSAVGFTFVDDGLVLTSENSQLKLAGVGVENSSVGAPEKILIVDDNSTMRTAVAKNNQFVTFANDSNFMPQTFIGQNSGLDFSNYNGELNINLTEGSGTIGAEIATLKGFDKLQAGNGYSTLIGNEENNTLIAGRGYSSLWGGSSVSDDLLIGGNSENTFFYCIGNGKDTIQSTNNGDLVMLSDISMEQIISAGITSNSVALNFADGGSLQVNGSKNVTYQLNDGSKFSANHQSLNWESK